jgi:YVTN family beta-propeller protein
VITHQPGSEIAGYRIESLIGRGGMAVVYRAEDVRLGRKVALKLLSPQLADSEQFRQRFIRESRLAASLDHPNIVPIYEAGEADEQLFIAMRYVVGNDLKGLLADRGGRLPVDWTVPIFDQVADALDCAHDAGLVHRDVKPGNILVAAGDRPRAAHGQHVYLTDFGLTKRTSELSGGLTGTGRFLGTVDYVSPEQIQGRPVGPATDIYALGCVLYEALTGLLPFRRDDDAGLLWAHLAETPPPVTGIRRELPGAVNAVVARAMAKEPADRYESCAELLRDLEQALAGSAPVPAPVPAGGETVEGAAATLLSWPAPRGSESGYSLAIDLGTSFVAAAVADDQGLEMFSLGDGSPVAPAAVYVRSDGQILTGDAAARRAVTHPDRFAREIKRGLGNPTPVMLGGTPYAIGDLLGALLEDVLVRAAERQGSAPAVVALTHPANWGPFRRELFRDLARSAGLPDALYTTEPEAAAAHYASTRRLSEGDVLAVYDLGGGTFDATVLRRAAQGFEIVGTPEGIERLGGADFDDAIFGHVNYLAGGALTEVDLSDARTAVALARLRQDCTLAKEALSVDTEATIPVFLPNRHLEVTLTRAELEGMIRAPIESTIGTLDRVLRAARVEASALAAVLLVGGSSRIPLVAQMVAEAFGRPTVVGPHPKHAVALGAALLAEARRTNRPAAAADVAGAERPSDETTTTDDQPAGAAPFVPAVPVPVPVPSGDTSSAAPASAARAVVGTVAATALATPVAAAAAPAPPAAVPSEPVPSEPGPSDAVPEPRMTTSPAPPLSGRELPPGDLPPGGVPAGVPLAGDRAPVPPAPAGELPPAPPQGPPPGRWRGWWVALIVGVVVLVLAGGGVLLYVNLRPSSPRHPAASTGTHSTTAARSHSTAPTTAPAKPTVAAAVPIPSLGPTIPVGPTPNFVVASPSGRQLYIASRDAGVVTVVDTAVNKVTATIPISAGPPQFLAFSPDGRTVYVSVWNDARTIAAVSVLDTTTNAIVATIRVHTRPFLAAVSPDGKRVFVPNHDTGTVSVIDAASNKVVTEFSVPPNPHSIAFTPDGSRVYIADHESNVVSVVQTSDDKVIAQIPVPQSPHNVAVHPTRPLAMVCSFDAGSVSAIDTTTNRVITTIPVGTQPQHVVYSADGRFAYVTNDGSNNLFVIDLHTFTVTAKIPTGRSPTSMAVLPNGTEGYVSNLDDGTLTVLHLSG